MYNCKHPHECHRILDGRYVECIRCGKRLADSWAPLNEVFDLNDYKRTFAAPIKSTEVGRY